MAEACAGELVAGLPSTFVTRVSTDSRRIKPGDLFVFYSDGILDARNRDGRSFAREKLEEIILGCQSQSADCVVSNIFKAVAEHAAGADPFDDQTVVAIRVKDGTGGPGKRK